ncbi:MAG: hypothetical protein KAV87_40325 [Desulfobacteraceae bacterium]|nr:hypothetical protein [Desulfobacteraceae bacterium]
MIQWAYFPQSDKPTEMVQSIVQVFQKSAKEIDSFTHPGQVSNEVLAKIAFNLDSIGFTVETGKKKAQKIKVPVLFGKNGSVEKSFEADAFHASEGFVLEAEAGRGVTNYQFLKDLFQACMMQEVFYLAIAVRNRYRNSNDFERVFTFFDTLYKSTRLSLPLKGVLIIGY